MLAQTIPNIAYVKKGMFISMERKIRVKVESVKDGYGNLYPKKIGWQDGRIFVIDRVVHSCLSEQGEVRYIVSVRGRQKILYRRKNEWYVLTV